jgi:nucleotide-binding universal stress UspA family protein
MEHTDDTGGRGADGDGSDDILAHALVAVATEDDARATAQALAPYQPDRVTTVHVVEKGEGVPDKTPVEQSEAIAADAYHAVREVFPDAAEHTAYGRDVAATIVAAAAEVDASAIVYRPRGGSRLTKLLAGDVATRLVSNATRPVIALPEPASDEP